MEELLQLLDDNMFYNELLEKFTVKSFSLEIDTPALTQMVRTENTLREGFVALNLNGDHVKNFKEEILSSINSDILFDVLSRSFLFNPTVSEKDVVINNYVDCIINWKKIPVFIPILLVDGKSIVVDNSLLFRVPVLPIQANDKNITANLSYLATTTLTPYSSLSSGEVELFTYNMSYDLVYSPLLPTIVVIKITEQTYAELVDTNPKYDDMLIEEFIEELISESVDDTGNVTNAFASSLGVSIKYFLTK